MNVYFSLVDKTVLFLVNKLDGVLDRYNVVLTVPVDEVDERAECCGFAGPGGTGHQDQSLAQIAEVEDLLGEAELLCGDDLHGDLPEYGTDPEAIHKQIRPEARDPLDLMGKVSVMYFLELLHVVVWDDRVQELLQPVGRDDGMVGKLNHVPAFPDHGSVAGRQVEVRCAHLHHPPEQTVDLRLACCQHGRCRRRRRQGSDTSDRRYLSDGGFGCILRAVRQ